MVPGFIVRLLFKLLVEVRESVDLYRKIQFEARRDWERDGVRPLRWMPRIGVRGDMIAARSLPRSAVAHGRL